MTDQHHIENYDWEIRIFLQDELKSCVPIPVVDEDEGEMLGDWHCSWVQFVHRPSGIGVGGYVRHFQWDHADLAVVERDDFEFEPQEAEGLLVRLYEYWTEIDADEASTGSMSATADLKIILENALTESGNAARAQALIDHVKTKIIL